MVEEKVCEDKEDCEDVGEAASTGWRQVEHGTSCTAQAGEHG